MSEPGVPVDLFERYSSDIVVVVDHLGRITWISTSVERSLGHRVGDLLGGSLLGLAHPDDGPTISALVDGPFDGRTHLVRVRAGDNSFVETSVAAVRDDRVEGRVLVARDGRDRSLERARSARHEQLTDLIRRVSLGFVDRTAEEFSDAVAAALADLAHVCGVDRAYVLGFDHADRVARVVHEWCAPGIASALDRRRSIPFDRLAAMFDPLYRLEAVVVASADELARIAPDDARAMRSEGIGATAVVPVAAGRTAPPRLDVAVGFEVLRSDRSWSSGDLAALRSLGQLYVQAQARIDAEQVVVGDLTRLRQVFGDAPVGLAVLDGTGRYQAVNPAFAAIVGRTGDDVIGRRWYELTDPEDLDWDETGRDGDRSAATDVELPDGRAMVIAKRYRRADGTAVWCRVSIRQVRRAIGDGGEADRIVVVEPLTDQRRAEQMVQPVPDADQRRLLDHLPDAVFSVDREGRWMMANPAAVALVDPSRTPEQGPVLDADLPAVLIAAWRPAIDAAFSSGTSAVIEVEVGRSDTAKVLQTRIEPDRDGAGTVTDVVVVCHDHTDRRIAESDLVHQAFHDALTGLPNRKLFLSHLEHAVAGLHRHPSLTAVMFFDLDRFKLINDTIGHAVGDELLIVVAQRLRGALRPEDVVARLGGDEFVVLLENLNEPTEAAQAAERLLAALSLPALLSGNEVTTGASIGIALTQDGSLSPGDLLKRADAAMYRAKERGRGRIEVYDEDLQAKVSTRLALSAEMRLAVERREFEVHYQPEIDMTTGEAVGLEALLRWRNPIQGMLDAEAFVPLAEETGLIIGAGSFALTEACRVASALNRIRPGRPLTASVNVSARQLANTSLTTQVADALSASGLPAGHLNLEISEQVLAADTGPTGNLLRDLRELGVRITLDAFGSGSSSLSRLARSALTSAKIERSIIARLPDDVEAVTTVSAMVALTAALGIKLIAVGVETDAQVDKLLALGCRYAQGTKYSPATTAAGFSAW